ncbi:DoxX family protein [Hymenobacter sp. BT683]|uniref:DoxX family protein n=1 Tax=Hymenobacter jeongseonensis TaxID=2791027 RepID=A0ABS0IH05_9BACT|nr:DoxX family protein [Hymenobacter jeongseonensis]MBF9237644.1 DoxX family protein [Hymenobacter jeongseonensis]
MIFTNRYRFHDLGLLLLRVGLGVMFMVHGFPKLAGGPTAWAGIGGVMDSVGLGFAPTFWGFLAALAEFGGGLLLALGLWFRLACFGLLITMIMATVMHATKGDGFSGYSHALESAFVFLGLLVAGPGRYSFDERLFGSRLR